MDWIQTLKNIIHVHRWQTTHVNSWYHPTEQSCSCGITREMTKNVNYDSTNVMPYDKVHWARSDGTTDKYGVND